MGGQSPASAGGVGSPVTFNGRPNVRDRRSSRGNNRARAAFTVVLTIAIPTTLLSYLWIFPTAVKLRYAMPHVHRPYRVPGGTSGIWLATGLITFWVALGSWVAVFPGTLENVLGIEYDFADVWGVSQLKYEFLTLGTLGVILLVTVIGYIAGAPVRARTATVPIETKTAPEPA